MNDKLTIIEKVGGWVSTLLLGKTKEIIVRTDERVLSLMNDVKDLKTTISDFRKTEERVSILVGDTKDIRKSIDDFRVLVSAQGEKIVALQIYTKYGVSHSPTVPNETGSELLKNSGFSDQYEKIKPKVFDLMDKMNLRTLYDYEVGAISALEQIKNDPEIDPIKNFVVSNPLESLELIFKIASWIIRDDYNNYKNNL